MENTPAVSVIIPMYNVEKYIAETLDSLLAQTFTDFELIVVNDCSPDSSRAIAKSYLEKFGGRMELLDNEKNSGPSASRNNGLRRAVGEYVFFMDADDLLLPNSLEQMYSFAKQSDADFVSFKLRCNVSDDGKEQIIVEHNQPKLESNEILVDYPKRLDVVDIDDLQIIKKTVPLKSAMSWRIRCILSRPRLPWEIWLKFLKRRFLLENELFFHENIRYAEDQVWIYGIFLCAKKIIYVPRVLYHHRQSEGSLVRTKRTPFERINMWVTTLTIGMKWIDNVMSKLEFIKQRPDLRYMVLEGFSRRCSFKIHKYTSKLHEHEMYDSIKQRFGGNWGDNDVLIAQLLTYIDTHKKHIDELEKQLKTVQSDSKPSEE